jgi:hypothetical protein
MLVYEHERTEDIVSRLVKIAGPFRKALLALAVVNMATAGGLLSSAVLGIPWPGVVLGLVVGVFVGVPLAAVAVIGIEWLSQVLVAHGAALAGAAPRKEGAGPGAPRN